MAANKSFTTYSVLPLYKKFNILTLKSSAIVNVIRITLYFVFVYPTSITLTQCGSPYNPNLDLFIHAAAVETKYRRDNYVSVIHHPPYINNLSIQVFTK